MKLKIIVLVIFLATLCGAAIAGTTVTVVSSSISRQSVVVEIAYPDQTKTLLCGAAPCRITPARL